MGSVALNRTFNKVHFVEISPFFQNLDMHVTEGQFIVDYLPKISSQELSRNYFLGTSAVYSYTRTDQPLTPRKGFVFTAGAAYVNSIRNEGKNERDFTRYTSSAIVYLPLSNVITVAVRAGGATTQGEPDFYQLNRLGGNENLRGFRRQRFYGKHAFYNNNELRFLWPTQNRFFDGKIGFVAFADQGRIWHPGETSNIWHRGFGGGPVIQVFNQLLINGSYGFSKEDRLLHLRLGYFF
jgi:outer membrane translocation and assembly module TamA